MKALVKIIGANKQFEYLQKKYGDKYYEGDFEYSPNENSANIYSIQLGDESYNFQIYAFVIAEGDGSDRRIDLEGWLVGEDGGLGKVGIAIKLE
jgi:hypothetical protein